MQETSSLIPGLGRSPGEEIGYPLSYSQISLVAQMVKNLPAMQETWVRLLGLEEPLEEGMQSTPVFLPGEFHGQRNMAGYSPWGCKESDMTKQLSTTQCSKDRQKKTYRFEEENKSTCKVIKKKKTSDFRRLMKTKNQEVVWVGNNPQDFWVDITWFIYPWWESLPFWHDYHIHKCHDLFSDISISKVRDNVVFAGQARHTGNVQGVV